MERAEARYVIFVDEVMFAAPLEEGDFRYFTAHILPTLRSLSDEEYMEGPAVIMHTFARYSYILYRHDVYWCAEWEPGLVVVRFSPDGGLAGAAMRSPIPNFGGREPAEKDVRNYDAAAENRQYNLVFTAWDAQFDAADREWRSFQPAEAKTANDYRAALSHSHQLGEQMQARYSGDDKFSEWSAQCKSNVRAWAGEGVRVHRCSADAEPGAAPGRRGMTTFRGSTALQPRRPLSWVVRPRSPEPAVGFSPGILWRWPRRSGTLLRTGVARRQDVPPVGDQPASWP